MKPTKFNRFASILAVGALTTTGSLFGQTVEINPVAAIPAAYTLVPSGTWNWDTDGNLEGWTANSQLTLDAGTPIGGVVSGIETAASADPNFTSPLVTIATPYRVIVEFRIKKDATDTSRIDLFWSDAGGGFAGARTATVAPATLAADGTFKVVRITFPAGKIATQLKQFRFDPIAELPNAGKSMQLDYLRVYTESVPALTWDPDTVTTGAQGGPGTWSQPTPANWWNGTTDVAWPGIGTSAVFAGTADTVTVTGTVNANYAEFQTTGYTVTGGTINLGSDTAAFNNSVASVKTRIDTTLQGSASLALNGGNTTYILTGNNTSLTGPVTQASNVLGISTDTALGTAPFTAGAGGNVFINPLDGDRSIANNVIFAGNRTIIDSTDLGTGLPVGNLTIGGTLALNCVSPGDVYLRKNLTVNGVVSGSNSGIGLFLAGNPGTLRLNSANTFTGGVKWTVGAVIEVAADDRLGAAANTLNFNASNGTLRALAGFASARAININGGTTGAFDTNGSDITLSGKITGVATAPAATILQKVGTGKLTLTGVGSTLNGGLRIDAGTCDITAGDLVTNYWNGNTGVGGGAEIDVSGGTFNTNSYLAVGTNANPTLEALLKVNGGAFTCTGELLVGQNGNGRFKVTSGTANLNQLSYGDGPDSSRTAIIDLDGGIVKMNRTNRRAGSATATINFNGSTVTILNDQTDLLHGTSADTTFVVKTGGAIIDTNGKAVTTLLPLVHDANLGGMLDGGLTKNGAGTLTLNATNTYTGPTKVNAGVLAVNGSSIDDGGKIDIVGGKVLIPASTVETVNTLFYNGVQQPAGVYGSSASGAVGANQNDTYFDNTGSGTLNVISGPGASGYSTWAAAFSSPALSNTAPTADPDNDGLSNLVEYALGKDPRYSSTPAGVYSGNTITYTKGSAAIAGADVSWTIEVSDTLASGSWTVGTFQAAGDASATIQYTFTPGTPAKKFARLKVISTP